jgi:integrase
MRIGEAAGLHVDDVDLINCVITVRRAVWNGREQTPKTENADRVIDFDPSLVEILRLHIGDRKTGQVFLARNGHPISGNNILKRVLHPLLERLEIPKAGLHAFRHSRVTFLRTKGTPDHLQLQWIGHSSLETTNGYDHRARKSSIAVRWLAKWGLVLMLDPMDPIEEGSVEQ